jgi:hypothetical protein
LSTLILEPSFRPACPKEVIKNCHDQDIRYMVIPKKAFQFNNTGYNAPFSSLSMVSVILGRITNVFTSHLAAFYHHIPPMDIFLFARMRFLLEH